ncbi:MAG: DsrE family protein [Burkholderiales bacterium]
MNCQEFCRLIHAYLDHELDLMTSLDLESHLKDCRACQVHHARLRALRDIEQQHLCFHSAPGSLKTRIARDLGADCREQAAARPRAWRAATAVLAVTLAALLTWMAVPHPFPATHPAAAHAEEKMVYHVASGTDIETALRNVANHIATSPRARLVVVAHNNGVDFLLRGAKNRGGSLYEPSVAQLKAQGVDFRVCQNTLIRRHIEADAVIPEAQLVPSGIAEISRLQTQEGYAYMKL